MLERVISGAVLVVLAVAVLGFGGYVTGAAMFLLSLGGVYELLRVYKVHNTALGIAAGVGTAIYYGLLFLELNKFVLPMLIGYILLILAIYVITYPKFRDVDVMAAVLAFFYVTVMLSYVYQIRVLKHGLVLVVMIFVCSWINDTCAYFVGVLFGKHKMAPQLSPKKSIEGLIGGIAGATIIATVYGIFFSKYVYELNNAPLIFAVTGALGAVIAVIGDLAASAIKRNNDVKDYGKLIPGHGGIMDRFDSIIFTAPIIYYCFVYMMGNVLF